MRRLEKFLLSNVKVWVVVVVLTLTAAGFVVFGALVKDAAERSALSLNKGNILGRRLLRVAEIPSNLSTLLFHPPPIMALSQRFEGQAGLDFADPVHFSGDDEGEAGYLFVKRYLPKFNMKPVFLYLTRKIISLEIIDLNRQKTVYVWQSDGRETRNKPFYLLPDGSLVTTMSWNVTRLDVCSNLVWQKPLNTHHSIERDADGNFWMPAFAWPSTLPGASSKFKDHELIRFSPSGDVLSRISLSNMLVRNGYQHLLYRLERYSHDPLHINDVQPVLRDGPFWRRGDVFVSLRTNSVVFLYRPMTDQVVWLQSGPWLHQHDVDIVSEHEISVFSNNSVRTGDGESRVLGANEVYIYDFATGEARSPWREAMRRHEVRTETQGAATLFDDGGVMIEESNFGRILRLSADGAVQWSYVNRASDGRVYRLGLSRWLDARYGAEVVRSLAACMSGGSAWKVPVEPVYGSH